MEVQWDSKKGKALEALEALRVVRGRASHIF
jgi:hypothetical protein